MQQQSAVFLTDAQALRLYGRPGEVDTVGVIADPGVSASALAGRIASALLRAAFVGAGMIPAGFTFALDPLPFVASVAICVAVARMAALFAARRILTSFINISLKSS